MIGKPRYLTAQVKYDLKRKMVLVAGPRQVGKTTLARSLPGAKTGYLNWDVAEHTGPYPAPRAVGRFIVDFRRNS